MVLPFDRCLVIWVEAHQCVDRIMTSVRLASVMYVHPNFLLPQYQSFKIALLDIELSPKYMEAKFLH